MNAGLVYACLAYLMWGLFPLYFRQLQAAAPIDIIVNRLVWTFVLMALLLLALGRVAWLRESLARPRLVGAFALSALLLAGNWLLFVWAVNHHHVIDASLGYFINPLVSVALGRLVLHERLRRAQWAAIALAAAGVLWLAVAAGEWPWIGLALALSFGLYGLMRKVAPLGALEGLALETLLLVPFALPVLLWWLVAGDTAIARGDAALTAWMLASAPITAGSLLLFAAGARRLPLATLGLAQYIAPSMQFGLGVWLFDEPFSAARLAGFAMIWAALALYSAEGLWTTRRRAAAAGGRCGPPRDRAAPGIDRA